MATGASGSSSRLSNATKIADIKVVLSVDDQTGTQITKSTAQIKTQIQSTAQIVRNSVQGVMRGLGTNITQTVLEPVLSVSEGFVRMGETAEDQGNRMIARAKLVSNAYLVAGSALLLLGAKEKQAQDILSNAIDNTGASVSDYNTMIEEAVSTGEKYGKTAVQTMNALTTLTNATHNAGEAINLLPEAIDLATVRHLSLDSAARQVALTIGGGGRLFRQYGIEIQKNADGTTNYIAMNEKLAGILSGAADAAANNFGGTLRRLGAETDDLFAGLAHRLGPALLATGITIRAVATAFEFYEQRQLKAEVAEASLMAKQEAEAAAAQAEADAYVAAGREILAANEAIIASSKAAATAAATTSAEFAASLTARQAAAMGISQAGTSVAPAIAIDESSLAISAKMQADLAALRQSAIQTSVDMDASFAEIDAAVATMGETVSSESIVAASAMQIFGASAEAAAVETEAASAGILASMGPVGWIMGGIAAISAIVGIGWITMGSKAKEAEAPIDSLTQALVQSNLAMDDNTKSVIANNAANSAAPKNLDKLGIAFTDYTDALQGSTRDQEAFKERLEAIIEANGKFLKQGPGKDKIALSFNDTAKSAKDLLDVFDKQVGSQNASVKVAQDEINANTKLSDTDAARAASLGMTADAYKDVLNAQTKKQGQDQTSLNAARSALVSDDQIRESLNMTEESWLNLVGPINQVLTLQRQYDDLWKSGQDVHAMYDPVINAYHTWAKQQQSVKDAQQNIVDTETQGNRSIQDSIQAVSDAEESRARTAQQGRDSIINAEKTVSDAYTQAASNIASAEDKVANSQQSARDAQVSLAQARKDAKQGIDDAIASLRDLSENEDKAKISLAQAELAASQRATQAAQDALNTATNITPAEAAAEQAKINAQIAINNAEAAKLAQDQTKYDVTDAEHNLQDTLKKNAETRAAAAAAIKAGIEGNEKVIAAEKQLKQAEKDETQSIKDLQKARSDAAYSEQQALKQLAKARQDAADANVKANRDVAKSVQSLADTRVSAEKANQAAIKQEQDAATQLEANRVALDNLEEPLHLTDGQVKTLGSDIGKMDKDISVSMAATGQDEVGKALVDVKRQLYEAILVAGGKTPQEAIAMAGAAIPAYKPPSKTPGIKNGKETPAFAAGGAFEGRVRGPGGPREDNHLAFLSSGEHVWTADEVAKFGGHNAMENFRKNVRGYAKGGEVFDERRMPLIADLQKSGLLNILGGKWAGSSEGGWANLDEVKNFIRSVDPLPYVFGAVGPNAYDCSGLVGEVWARLTKHPSYHRYFTTKNERDFFQPGPGKFSVGFSNEHTVGNLDGLKFEAANPQDGILIGDRAQDVHNLPNVYHLPELLSSRLPGSAAGRGDVGKGGHLSSSAARAAGRTMMPAGWNFNDLDSVFTGESGWRWDAYNPGGPAYGIPQSLPPEKMASAGADWHDNALTQIKWGLGYIADRYGNPTVAERHEKLYNWYDQGGVLPPGDTLVRNRTGKPEAILTEDQFQMLSGAGGLRIDNVTFQVNMDDVSEVQRLIKILNDLPQAVRSMAGVVRKGS